MVHRVLRYAFVRVTGWIVEHRDLETGVSTLYIPGLEPNTAPLAVVSADGRLVYNHAPWGERVMLTTDERGRVASSYAWFAYGGRRVFRRRPHRPRRYRRGLSLRVRTAPPLISQGVDVDLPQTKAGLLEGWVWACPSAQRGRPKFEEDTNKRAPLPKPSVTA